jgi:hypothetical protein
MPHNSGSALCVTLQFYESMEILYSCVVLSCCPSLCSFQNCVCFLIHCNQTLKYGMNLNVRLLLCYTTCIGNLVISVISHGNLFFIQVFNVMLILDY